MTASVCRAPLMIWMPMPVLTPAPPSVARRSVGSPDRSSPAWCRRSRRRRPPAPGRRSSDGAPDDLDSHVLRVDPEPLPGGVDVVGDDLGARGVVDVRDVEVLLVGHVVVQPHVLGPAVEPAHLPGDDLRAGGGVVVDPGPLQHVPLVGQPPPVVAEAVVVDPAVRCPQLDTERVEAEHVVPQPDARVLVTDGDGGVVEGCAGDRLLDDGVDAALDDEPCHLHAVCGDPHERAVRLRPGRRTHDGEPSGVEAPGRVGRRTEAVERRHGAHLALDGDGLVDGQGLAVVPGADPHAVAVARLVERVLHQREAGLRTLGVVVVDDEDPTAAGTTTRRTPVLVMTRPPGRLR